MRTEPTGIGLNNQQYNRNMPSKSWGVIYCPKEGSPRTHKRWKEIRRCLDANGVLYDYVQSEGAGSVERLASMMTKTGYRTIVVVGGDAALNHALCGIMQTESPSGQHPILGVIPNGFGNDFARYWGLAAEDYEKTIKALLLHHTRKVDVGRVCSIDGASERRVHYFLNCVNLGVASSITNLRRKTRSFFGFNTVSYFTSSLLLLFQRMSFKFQFKMSGEQVDKRGMTLCIGSAHGYGQTPSAVPYNGLLDVTLVSKPQLLQIFHGLWLLFTGRFLSHRGVSVWRTRHMVITSTGRALVSMDGRVLHHGIQAMDISVLPEEIEFLIP